MKLKKILPLLFILFTGTAFSNDYGHRGHVSRDAKIFAKSIRHVARNLRHRTGYSHISRDARKLARKVRHFRHSVHDGHSNRHIHRDFHRIKRAYYHFMRVYRQAHNVHHNNHLRRDIRSK